MSSTMTDRLSGVRSASTPTSRLNGIRSSLAYKAPCRVVTTANIALSGFQTINGVTLADGDTNLRVLVAAQDAADENGIWLASSGAWSRATDFDGNTDIVQGTQVRVVGGSSGVGVYYVATADPIVVGTSDIAFSFYTDASTALIVTFDNGVLTLAANMQTDIVVPFPAVITAVRLMGDQTGSVVVDIWKDSFASYPPTLADSITGSAKPTISAALKSVDTTLAGWTTTLAAGDVLRFVIDSVSTFTRLTVAIEAVKTS